MQVDQLDLAPEKNGTLDNQGQRGVSVVKTQCAGVPVAKVTTNGGADEAAGSEAAFFFITDSAGHKCYLSYDYANGRVLATRVADSAKAEQTVIVAAFL